MSYLRAEEVLPQELIQEIQRYVNGACIYIPSLGKRDWGSRTATRQSLAQRNLDIYRAYSQGANVRQLAERFFLSEKSIQRILRLQRRHG